MMMSQIPHPRFLTPHRTTFRVFRRGGADIGRKALQLDVSVRWIIYDSWIVTRIAQRVFQSGLINNCRRIGARLPGCPVCGRCAEMCEGCETS